MPSGCPIAPYILYNHVIHGQALTTPLWLQYLAYLARCAAATWSPG